MTSFAVHQPNYLPWLGFFAKMSQVDVFVVLDDVQLPQGRSYVSRTRIRDRDDARWLTVPIRRSAKPPINEVLLADEPWADKHLRSLQMTYGRSPAYAGVMPALEEAFRPPPTHLSTLNEHLLAAAARLLGIEVRIERSSELRPQGTAGDRIIDIGHRLRASTYVSGAGGQNYQEREAFEAAGIELVVREYAPVPYEQAQGAFVPGLSVVDALVNLGAGARDLLI